MSRSIGLLIVLVLFITGCSQSTKNQVYNDPWDENPIVVYKLSVGSAPEVIHEITDATTVEKLVETLKNANWDENVEVDMPAPNYQFTYNAFEHYVWFNEETGRVELTIADRSNYVLLSEKSSAIVRDILTGKNQP